MRNFLFYTIISLALDQSIRPPMLFFSWPIKYKDQSILAPTLFFRIFLDLCKAFDTVDHRIILNKLEYYGIWGVVNDWFASYLSNRRQFVSLFGTNSDYQTVTCRVPQGSVLGPHLFLLYINDMPKCSNILEFHLFADDTNLFLNSPNILNLETNLNVELEKVS